MESYLGDSSLFANHAVEIHMQYEDYKGVVTVNLKGNVYGLDVLGSIINDIEEDELIPMWGDERNAKHCVTGDEGLVREYILYNDKGETLSIDSVDISDCIIGIVITAWSPLS